MPTKQDIDKGIAVNMGGTVPSGHGLAPIRQKLLDEPREPGRPRDSSPRSAMTEPLRIVVRGQPKPQGSKKPFINKATGKPGMKESSGDALAWWRRAVTEHALTAMAADYQKRLGEPVTTASRFPLEGPVILTAVFAFKRPDSHYGTGRNSHLLKDSAPAEPCNRKQGDLSHLIRAVEDSLTDAGIWGDDSQVTRYGDGTGKYWTTDTAHPLDVPGAVITIRPVT